MLGSDLAYAARTLRKNPAFTLTAVITLALGIGASTAIFSVVNAVLLRPLPYADPSRLVFVQSDMRNRHVQDFPIAPGDLKDIRDQGTLFQGFAGVVTGPTSLVSDGPPEQLSAAFVTPNIFSILGLRIAFGRNFVDADAFPLPVAPKQNANAPGTAIAGSTAAPVRLPQIAILSHGFWQRRFGGDSSVIGRTIQTAGGPALVVGVLEPNAELLAPPKANLERTPDLWTPIRIDLDSASRINVIFQVVARLKPGTTLGAAQHQMDLVASGLRERFPIEKSVGAYLRVEPMRQYIVASVRPALLALMGAVTFVLLIACANVANLLLVRASTRERELAVRSAVGATRWSLVRQMLTESIVLAAAGSLVALALAKLGIMLLLSIAPATLPRVDTVGVAPMVFVFAMLAGGVAAALFGIVPALRASRPELAGIMRTSGRTPGLQGAGKLSDGVVVLEVALSFVLLVGCGLLFRTFVAVADTNPGFDPNGLLTFTLPFNAGPTPQARQAKIEQVQHALASIPGVTGVTAGSFLPLDGTDQNGRWGTEAARSDLNAFHQAEMFFIEPGFFPVMRTRLIAGREFSASDNSPDARVAIVDQALAAMAFPHASAIGQHILIRAVTDAPQEVTIVGIVAHQRHTTLTSDEREEVYFPDGYAGFGALGRWAVRTSGDPTRIIPLVRSTITRLDPQIPIGEIKPMTAYVDRAMAPTRFALVLIGVFAGVAAILAAIGLYGVLSSLVRQRTAEIGIRMAFGATSASVFRLVIGQGLRLSAIGVVAGIAGGLALTGLIQSLLVGVRPSDPTTFASMVLLFLIIAALAAWVPARRAAMLDPNVALREE